MSITGDRWTGLLMDAFVGSSFRLLCCILLIAVPPSLFLLIKSYGVGATWVLAYNSTSGGYSPVRNSKLVGRGPGGYTSLGAQGK